MKVFNIILFSLLICSISARAQNVFTFANNGTFESPESEWKPALQASSVNAGIVGVTYTRSSTHFKEGTYSLKVQYDAPGSFGGGSATTPSVIFPFVNNNPYTNNGGAGHESYGASLWIFIPSDENLSLSALTPETFAVWSFVGTVAGGGSLSRCRESHGKLEMDKWIQINPVLTGNITLMLTSSAKTYVFYIDKVEAVYSTPVVEGSIQLTENSIDLGTPTGGIQVIQGIQPPTSNPTTPGTIYNLGYSYLWNDQQTTKDRTGLTPPGTLYSVTITNPPISEDFASACRLKKSLFFIVGRPDMPNTNDVSICQNQSTTLIATDPAPQTYRGISWYDEAGVQLSQTSSLARGPFTTPGVYKFYAQIDIIGFYKGLSSYRKEVIVTVNPLPDPQLKLSTIVFNRRPLTISAQNPQQDYQYNYKFYYGSGGNTTFEQVNTPSAQVSYTFHDLGSLQPAIGFHNIDVVVVNSFGCSKTFNFNVEVKNYEPLCETVVPIIPAGTQGNPVKLDKFSGQFVFQKGTTCVQNVNIGCIQSKVDAPSLTNVVSASAVTFSDQWNYDAGQYPYPFVQTNPYENGTRGKWRPEATYAFNTGEILYDKNYNSGTFQLRHFNWQYPKSSKLMGWIEANHVDKYSPNGEAVEEHNALDISSAAKFGYGGSVPYLIAQNADYNSVLFESFEYMTNNKFEDGFAYASGSGMQIASVAHSGNSSLSINAGIGVPIPALKLSSHVKIKGLLVKVWAKNVLTNGLAVIANTTTLNFSPVKQTGEWTLYQAKIESNLLTSLTNLNLTIKNQSATTIMIDDLRIQPQDAAMTAYVYDKNNLRLLAVFDDQHFGLYYQYNTEGKLVRKIIETERGLKTLQETQYNTPSSN
jgi:hypothetical protein